MKMNTSQQRTLALLERANATRLDLLHLIIATRPPCGIDDTPYDDVDVEDLLDLINVPLNHPLRLENETPAVDQRS